MVGNKGSRGDRSPEAATTANAELPVLLTEGNAAALRLTLQSPLLLLKLLVSLLGARLLVSARPWSRCGTGHQAESACLSAWPETPMGRVLFPAVSVWPLDPEQSSSVWLLSLA